MGVTYYVALPFVVADDGSRQAKRRNPRAPNTANMRAEAISRKPGCAGALAFSRTSDPASGEFSDAKVIRNFGDCPRT
jgi:hypothetical protein